MRQTHMIHQSEFLYFSRVLRRHFLYLQPIQTAQRPNCNKNAFVNPMDFLDHPIIDVSATNKSILFFIGCHVYSGRSAHRQ